MTSILLIIPILLFILIVSGNLIGSRGLYIIIAFSFAFLLNLIIIFIIEIILLHSIITNFFYNWICIYFFSIPFITTLNFININMLMLITIISSLVHYYSIEYMKHDPNKIKFFIYLLIFTESMFILVCADNFLYLFIGWEGVGISSFLLISFWNTRRETARSAFLAVILNKIGDLTLLIAIIYCLNYYNILSFESLPFILNIIKNNIYLFTNETTIYYQNIIFYYILIAIIAKSGQLGLHMWLPEAMEGPTPVSALLHAATMVTAGIYLLIKLNFLLIIISNINLGLLIITSFGIIIFTINGLFQEDAKKSIAYSTCAQLSFMAFACVHQLYSIAFFHLIIHAFFKAGLFLMVGYLSHIDEEDDLENLYVIHNTYTITLICTVFALTSIGLFDIGATLSKEKILEFSINTLIIFEFYQFYIGFACIYLIFMVNGLYYSIYTYTYLTIESFPIKITYNNYILNKKKYFNYNSIHHSLNTNINSNIMLNTLIILTICSIYAGQLLIDLFIGDYNLSWNIYNECSIVVQSNITSIIQANELLTIPIFTLLIWLYGYIWNQITYDYISQNQHINISISYSILSTLLTNKLYLTNLIISNIINIITNFLNYSIFIEKKIMEYPYFFIFFFFNNIIFSIYNYKKGFYTYYISIFIYIIIIYIIYSVFLI